MLGHWSCVLMWLLAATAFVAGQAARDDIDYVPELKPVKICDDGLTFHEGCNICICNKDGTRKFCTTNKCTAWGNFWSKVRSPITGEGSGCEAGREYKVGCHSCECDDDGHSIVCPDVPCIPTGGPVLKKYLRALQH